MPPEERHWAQRGKYHDPFKSDRKLQKSIYMDGEITTVF